MRMTILHREKDEVGVDDEDDVGAGKIAKRNPRHEAGRKPTKTTRTPSTGAVTPLPNGMSHVPMSEEVAGDADEAVAGVAGTIEIETIAVPSHVRKTSPRETTRHATSPHRGKIRNSMTRPDDAADDEAAGDVTRWKKKRAKKPTEARTTKSKRKWLNPVQPQFLVTDLAPDSSPTSYPPTTTIRPTTTLTRMSTMKRTTTTTSPKDDAGADAVDADAGGATNPKRLKNPLVATPTFPPKRTMMSSTTMSAARRRAKKKRTMAVAPDDADESGVATDQIHHATPAHGLLPRAMKTTTRMKTRRLEHQKSAPMFRPGRMRLVASSTRTSAIEEMGGVAILAAVAAEVDAAADVGHRTSSLNQDVSRDLTEIIGVRHL